MLKSKPPLRVGILSTAKIARQFVLGVRASRKIKIVCVASRDRDRARRFAQEFEIDRCVGSYDDLLADPQVDAIYNPLPNSLHAHWSIRALQAGKHVLCEKPLAATADEARKMMQVAHDCGLHLAEGYPYRSQPLTLRLQQLLRAGEIGKLKFIQASFGFMMADEANIRLNPTLAGGSLGDAGCYPVSLVRMLAGMRPIRVATWTATGVDQSIVANLEFESGLLAQVSSSFGTAHHRVARIIGDAGIIETNYLNTPPAGQPASLLLKRGTGWDAATQIIEAPAINGFLAEAESFSDLIEAGPAHWSGASSEESVDIMRTLDAILSSAKSGNAVTLGTD